MGSLLSLFLSQMERESAWGIFSFWESPALSGRSESIKGGVCVGLALILSLSRMELHLPSARQLVLLSLGCVLITGKSIPSTHLPSACAI